MPLIACAGCLIPSEPSQPYAVIAVADLAGIGSDIAGPIEILGANSGSEATKFDLRTLAAYRVRLPDSSPRRARIYDVGSCDVPTVSPPPEDGCGRIPCPEHPPVLADLQKVQRVGNETHFFAQNILVHGQRLDVDTETVQAAVSLVPDARSYVIGKIAVIQAADREDGSRGEWQACGVFAIAAGR
jgi:hypothetical protein